MEFSSKLVEQAVEEISKLPGIGKKTALRLALHLLKQPKNVLRSLNENIYLITYYFYDQKSILKLYRQNSVLDFLYPSRAECNGCIVQGIKNVFTQM